MADIRIKDLAVTASASSSDDYLAIDGSTNGTRKLSAYSPTFGGNLTVNGTGTSTLSGNLDVKKDLLIYGSNASSSGGITANSAAGGLYFYGQGTSTGMRFYTTDGAAASQLVLSLESTKQATFEGNLVVSGGTATVSGSSGYLKLTSTTASKTWDLFADNSGSFIIAHSGVVNALQINPTTGNTYVTGQLRSSSNIVASNLGSADTGFYGTAGADAGSGHRLALVRTDTPSGGSALLSAYGAAVVEVNATTGINTGTRALTLDTSANATFAGNAQIGASYGGSQKKLEIIGGSYADGQTLRLADYSTAYGFDIVNDGVNGKLKIIRHENSVGGTEAMSIDRASGNATFAGQVNSGTSSSSGYNNNYNVQLEGSVGRLIVNKDSASSSGTIFAGFGRNGSGLGSITQDGTTGVLYNTTSDARLKTNIRDVTNSGSIIDALKPRVFDWKNYDDKDRFGFLAQEVHAVFPQAVKKGDDGEEVTDAWAMDAAKLVPVLVAELKTLRARVAALETA